MYDNLAMLYQILYLMTDFTTLLYTSTCQIPNHFRAEPPIIGHFREYPRDCSLFSLNAFFCRTLKAVKDL